MASPSSYPFLVGYNDAVTTTDPNAHRRHSVECFNRAWELIELPQRTSDEESEMLRLAMTSLWHWTQRPECGERERSIGCWQVSRCAALAGHASLARDFADRALRHAAPLTPFFQGYGHEAVARAAALAGDSATMERHAAEAHRCAAAVDDAEERQRLLTDLDSIERPASRSTP